MTVVSNATPLINFAAINRLDILEAIFGQVFIHQAVFDETTVSGFSGSKFVLESIASTTWLQIRPVSIIAPKSKRIICHSAACVPQGVEFYATFA